MLATLRARREDDERGFTLIELMVVVLIIAILIAIAIPTFLGAQSKAKDRAAQSSLRNALTTEKTVYTDTQLYTSDATTLKANEPSLKFQTAASTGPKIVSVSVAADTDGNADQVVVMGAKSAAGTCYFMRDTATGPGTEFAAGKAATCDAASPVTGVKDWNSDGW
jgi:type IV pilus assembly protein PilA